MYYLCKGVRALVALSRQVVVAWVSRLMLTAVAVGALWEGVGESRVPRFGDYIKTVRSWGSKHLLVCLSSVIMGQLSAFQRLS